LKLPYNGRIVRLTHFVRRGVIDDSDDDGGSGVGSDNIYRKRAEPVLVLPSDLYSKDQISVYDSRSSFCPAYTFYFYYCLKEFYMILS